MNLIKNIYNTALKNHCPFCNIDLTNGSPVILTGVTEEKSEFYQCSNCNFELCHAKGVFRTDELIRWECKDFICGIDSAKQDIFYIWENKKPYNFLINIFLKINDGVVFDKGNFDFVDLWKREAINNLNTIEDLQNIITRLMKESVFK